MIQPLDFPDCSTGGLLSVEGSRTIWVSAAVLALERLCIDPKRGETLLSPSPEIFLMLMRGWIQEARVGLRGQFLALVSCQLFDVSVGEDDSAVLD